MILRRDFLWRTAYEGYAAFAWFAALSILLSLLVVTAMPRPALIVASAYALCAAVIRTRQAFNILQRRLSLEHRRVEWISSDELHRKVLTKPNHVWLGWGFEWTGHHTQRLRDLALADLASLRVPGIALWRRLRGVTPAVGRGNPLLHGVELHERDIFVPLSDLEGHVFVAATTGTLKTKLLALLASQAIRREPRECVVVIDPKGDRDLLNLMRTECAAAGRADDFAYFHPAFPQQSVRIDTLSTWTRTTEIASRIAALMAGESANDPFAAFAWRILHLVAEGCVATHGERPTLRIIRRYVEGGVDQLLHNTLVGYLERIGVDWREEIRPLFRSATRGRLSPATSPELVAMVQLYQKHSAGKTAEGAIDGLISMFLHNREHAQKMLASLIPILTMLTAGDLAGLLSPDRDDASDLRPILTGASIADSASVVYIGLDALSDSVVAFAIASIIISDLSAYAGWRFNAGINTPRVNLFVDESNEAMNSPAIQLLNKGRGAGFGAIFFSQTVPDFVVKLGSEAKARQVLGNANSLIAGRTRDSVTGKYIVESFGTTMISGLQQSQGVNTVVDGSPLRYGTSYGIRSTETEAEIVSLDSLARIPDLQYFASFSGGALLKGRIPLIRSGLT